MIMGQQSLGVAEQIRKPRPARQAARLVNEWTADLSQPASGPARHD
jgi:hypothetical protein